MAKAWIVPLLPFAGVTASSSAVGYDPGYLGNDLMGVMWRAGAVGPATLLIDLGSDRPVDTVQVLGAIGATAGWTVRFQAATQAQGASFGPTALDSGVIPFLAGSEMPVSGRGHALWGAAQPAAARYVRITIDPAGGTANAARVVIGERLRLARNFQFGATAGVRDLGRADFSRLGVLDRQRGAKLRTLGLTFPGMTRTEAEAGALPLLERAGNTDLIAIVTDPDADPMRQRRMYLGVLVGDLSGTWRRADGWEVPLNLVSVI
ncbi:MAG TPA: hypothetical protein DEP91_04395 [Sphingomonas bacterium]|jgi:hypothetical protein|uniref:F5/8 type C domain-containing protein n=1 Tax=Sphingomonas bacterium TaxID=1895847 RepID=A0A3D0W9W4_9SPHN|nr:hypothetical protein [Sphingomonas bacterium]